MSDIHVFKVNSLDQFLVDSDFGPGDLEMGTVVREDYDLVTPRKFVWTYHSLLIKEIIHMNLQGLIQPIHYDDTK